MSDEAIYWPFPVRKPEARWSEFDRDFLNFMQTAYAENFQPHHRRTMLEIEAGNPEHRSALLVWRGRRNGFEPFLCERRRTIRLGPYYGLDDTACVCVRPPFYAAGYLSLEWMRGRSLEQGLSCFDFEEGMPARIILRPEYFGSLAVCESSG